LAHCGSRCVPADVVIPRQDDDTRSVTFNESICQRREKLVRNVILADNLGLPVRRPNQSALDDVTAYNDGVRRWYSRRLRYVVVSIRKKRGDQGLVRDGLT